MAIVDYKNLFVTNLTPDEPAGVALKANFLYVADELESLRDDVDGLAGGHTHAIGQVTGLQAALDGKAASTHDHDGVYSPVAHSHTGVYALASHTHAIANVTGLQAALDGKSATGHDHAGVYALASHTHAISNVTGLQAALDDKSYVGHTHAQSDVTDLVPDLAAKAPLASPAFTGTVTIDGEGIYRQGAGHLKTDAVFETAYLVMGGGGAVVGEVQWNRANASGNSRFYYRTAGGFDWSFGQRGDGTLDFGLFNETSGLYAMRVSYSTGDVGFGAAVTATGHVRVKDPFSAYHYEIARSSVTGHLDFSGTQVGFVQFNFLAPLFAASLTSLAGLTLRGQSSTTERPRAMLDVLVIDNVDATRKYAVDLVAYDTAARAGVRVWADGADAHAAMACPNDLASGADDPNMPANTVTFTVDEAADELVVTVKYGAGTVKTARVALA